MFRFIDTREIKEFLRDAGIYIITIGILLIFLIFIISFQPIAGNSMVPTLEEGNIVMVSKLSYRLGKIKRNDIIYVVVNKKSYVKRIIGLPGEDIKYLKNILYINDEPYTEEFLDKNIETSGFTLEDVCKKDECPNGVIPEGKYLVLGDNRPESEDSRTASFGLVSEEQIKGKIFFRIWPLNKIGKIN